MNHWLKDLKCACFISLTGFRMNLLLPLKFLYLTLSLAFKRFERSEAVERLEHIERLFLGLVRTLVCRRYTLGHFLGSSLDSQLPLHFAQKRHIMRDANRHGGFLGLLLNKTPLDAEVVVG